MLLPSWSTWAWTTWRDWFAGIADGGFLAVAAWVGAGLLLMVPQTLHVQRNPCRLRILVLGFLPWRTLPQPLGFRLERRRKSTGRGGALVLESQAGRSVVIADSSDPFHAEALGCELSDFTGLPFVRPEPLPASVTSPPRDSSAHLPFYRRPTVGNPQAQVAASRDRRLKVRRGAGQCEIVCPGGVRLLADPSGGYLGCGLLACLLFATIAAVKVCGWMSGPPALRLGFLQDAWFWVFSCLSVLLGVMLYPRLWPQPSFVVRITADCLSFVSPGKDPVRLLVDDIANVQVVPETETTGSMGFQTRSGHLFTISRQENQVLWALEVLMRRAVRDLREEMASPPAPGTDPKTDPQTGGDC